MRGANTVIEIIGGGGERRIKYVVRCACGDERTVGINTLRHGSHCWECGKKILAKKRRVENPVEKMRLYRVYRNMLRRCNDKFNHSYRWYGGKGIKVEFGSFREFKAWALMNGYADGLSIERRDPKKNYAPSNCEWITVSENTRRAQEPWRKQNHFPIEMLWGSA